MLNRRQISAEMFDLEHEAKAFSYLLYTVVIWLFYISDVRYTVADLAASQPSDVAKSASYGVFRYIYLLKRDATSLSAVSHEIITIVAIHALRIFLGIYFIGRDESFQKAKKTVYENLSTTAYVWRRAFEVFTVISQVFLLGLLAYAVKSSWVIPVAAIMFLQALLIVFYDVVNRDVLWKDSDKFGAFVIVGADCVILAFSFLFLIVLLHWTSIDVFEVTMLPIIGIVLFVFFLEVIFAYGKSLWKSVRAFLRLIQLLGRSVPKQWSDATTGREDQT